MRVPGIFVLGLLATAIVAVACSTAGPTDLGSANAGGSDGSPPASGGIGASAGGGMGGTAGTIPTLTGGTMSEGGACAEAQSQATLVKEPVDIIVVLDNSGSMDEELDAVERNINDSFARILTDGEVDYRMILISRHRKEARNPANPGAEDTSVCIEAPLSGLATCPSPNPVFSERFYHYFTKIESNDSFDVTLDTYAAPFAVGFEDRADQAPAGWSAWLRPGAKKVFLEMSDDNEDTPVAAFLSGLTTAAPEHFGTDAAAPNLVFHSIIGVAEKATPTEPYLPTEPVETDRCPSVTTEGRAYQELSILTGGLRFPICGFDAYDVVFRRIAEDVVTRVLIACDFAIPPPPPGKDLELEKVAVNYTAGDGSDEERFLQAQTPTDCGPDAFYIDADRIVLCPEACDIVQADGMARVDVEFTCESTIIVR
jgi:hypothetical protein